MVYGGHSAACPAPRRERHWPLSASGAARCTAGRGDGESERGRYGSTVATGDERPTPLGGKERGPGSTAACALRAGSLAEEGDAPRTGRPAKGPNRLAPAAPGRARHGPLSASDPPTGTAEALR